MRERPTSTPVTRLPPSVRAMTAPSRESITAAHVDAELAEHFGPLVAAVVVGEYDRASARRDAKAAQIRFHRAGEHHARLVVAAEDERPLVRAGREHALLFARKCQRRLCRRASLSTAQRKLSS